ncbi:MAG: hypothetical protein KC506_02430, partial [Nanoarchaeota archaeon]|nr:hypothetical protein [Nanoarchaeota archaeon]
DGRTLAEAFAHSNVKMNWMFEVVGDPLLQVPVWWQNANCGDSDGICPVGCSFFDDGDVDCSVGECISDFDCSDDYSCTTNTCNTGSGVGVCEFDNANCDCALADVNGGGVDVNDLISIGNYYVTGDLAGDVNSDESVDIFDLIFVASRIGVCRI